MAVQLDCPSCGASVKVRRGLASVTCQYCGSSILVPEYLAGKPTTPDRAPVYGKSCGKTAITLTVVAFLLVIGIAGAVFYFVAPVKERASQSIAAIAQSQVLDAGPEIVMEFGGSGTGPGYFQRPECIAIDANGSLFVGERENNRIQVFDSSGEFISQWFFADKDDVYLSAMSCSRTGDLYLVFDSNLYLFNGETGEYIDLLEHPEGWGFSDVDVAPDGSILASWYKNRDDIILFNSSGEVELVIEEAISSQTGDSELSTMIAAGNLGEIFAYGSFNETVMVFNADGRYLDRFGNEDMLIMPTGMDMDPLGRLWISDFGDLILFSTDGELLQRINLDNSIRDFVISDDMQLYGISADETIVQIDLTSY